MLTHFRLIAFAGVAAIAAAASATAGLWPPPEEVARLSPGYGGVCEDCDLSGRILVDARLIDSEFRNAIFSAAVMTRVRAAGARFDGSDFSDAILDYANFERARFGRARMERASLVMANFSGADLSQARGLTQDQLSRACGDDATRLPPRLTIPACPAADENTTPTRASPQS